MRNFKVLTLNIHKGFSAGNRRFTLEHIRECLRESGANIVFLQVVSGENSQRRRTIPGWPDTNQFEFLADSVWSHYAYGKNAIYQHGHHGNAILSEIPFLESSNMDVSFMRFSQRGILHGVLEHSIHVLCIHLGLFEKERRQQIARLIDYINTRIPPTAPLIIAGNFNDWRESSHRELSTQCGVREAHECHHKTMAKTFPAMLPCLPMDRIYVRGFTISNVEVKTSRQWRTISDHCAMLADLEVA
jgi:endonuclease/exonuclease/phosphatase family metal-dependent hydrolase